MFVKEDDLIECHFISEICLEISIIQVKFKLLADFFLTVNQFTKFINNIFRRKLCSVNYALATDNSPIPKDKSLAQLGLHDYTRIKAFPNFIVGSYSPRASKDSIMFKYSAASR